MSLKIYVSHKISDGGILTEDIMEKNCKAVIDFVNLLRKDFPNVTFYVPAEHEDFVHRAYTNKMLTIPQILEIDCQIINTCDVMLVYSPDNVISAGMQVEVDHCDETGKYVVYISSSTVNKLNGIKKHLLEVFSDIENNPV